MSQSKQPLLPIPSGCYDTGEGFYNPKTKCLYSKTEPNTIIRIPTSKEEQWILEYCPKAWTKLPKTIKIDNNEIPEKSYQQFFTDDSSDVNKF